MGVGQKAEVADPAKAVGQDMQQKTPDELVRVECHHPGLVGLPIVFPTEPDLPILKGKKAMIGDGDAMGIAAKIVEDLLRATERSFGVDDPVGPTY